MMNDIRGLGLIQSGWLEEEKDEKIMSIRELE